MENLDPKQLEALIQRAFQNKNLPLAEQACLRLREQMPNHPRPSWLLAQIHRIRGASEQAIEAIMTCIALAPQRREFRLALAQAYQQAGRHEDAIAVLEELIRRNPELPDAKIRLAEILEFLSRYEESEKLIQELLSAGAVNPQITLIRAHLALHQGRHQEAVKLTLPARETTQLSPTLRSTLLFICGQAYDKLGDAEQAIKVLHVANKLHHAPFDRQAFKEDVDRTLEYFTSERLAKCDPISPSQTPIFIATMPRSGSSMLDQMIQSHPLAAGAGELAYFFRFRMRLMKQGGRLNYPAGIDKLSRKDLGDVAAGYLDRISSVQREGILRVSDKSIENFREYGVISMLFPNARMIHLKRNALDCCLSIYMNRFGGNLLPQTCSLRNIGFFYQQHQRCMQHWKENAGLSILEVAYEDLVADPERELRRILEYCDLPWDESCLDFHRSKRVVKTLSYHQVSKPLNSSSIGKAEKYLPYIGELLEELEGPTCRS